LKVNTWCYNRQERFNISVPSQFLLSKNDSNCGALLVGRFDAHNVAAQPQRAVCRAADSGIVEDHLELGLKLRAVVQVDKGALQS
jgi:hypothetical protein